MVDLLEEDPVAALRDVVDNPADEENNVVVMVEVYLVEVIDDVLLDVNSVVLAGDDELRKEVVDIEGLVKDIEVGVVKVLIVEEKLDLKVLKVEAGFVIVESKEELVVVVTEDPCCLAVVVVKDIVDVVIVLEVEEKVVNVP